MNIGKTFRLLALGVLMAGSSVAHAECLMPGGLVSLSVGIGGTLSDTDVTVGPGVTTVTTDVYSPTSYVFAMETNETKPDFKLALEGVAASGLVGGLEFGWGSHDLKGSATATTADTLKTDHWSIAGAVGYTSSVNKDPDSSVGFSVRAKAGMRGYTDAKVAYDYDVTATANPATDPAAPAVIGGTMEKYDGSAFFGALDGRIEFVPSTNFVVFIGGEVGVTASKDLDPGTAAAAAAAVSSTAPISTTFAIKPDTSTLKIDAVYDWVAKIGGGYSFSMDS